MSEWKCETCADTFHVAIPCPICSAPNETIDRWIPCADRLPEKDQEVLIYLDENEGGMLELGYTSLITIAIYTGEGDEWSSDWEADANAPIDDGCQPTHWMPLPEPPKEA